MSYKKKKTKLFTSNIFTFTLLVLIPTIIIFTFLTYTVRKEMINQNTKIHSNTLIQTAINIETEIKTNSIMASAIVHDIKIIEEGLIFSNAKTLSENYKSHTNLDKIIQSYLVSNNFAGEIYLVFNDSNKFYLGRNATCIDSTYEQLQQILDETDPSLDKVQIVDRLYSNIDLEDPHTMAIVTYPPDQWGYQESYIAEILIAPLSSVKQLYNNENLKNPNSTLLVNNSGLILASNNTNLIGNQLNSVITDSKKQVVLKQHIKNSPWSLVKIVNLKEITKNVDKVFKVVYILLAILFLLYIVYNILILIRITKPLNQLIDNMKKVGQGNYSKQEIPTIFYELESLNNSFYSMIDELELLNKQIVKAHQETLVNEIEALRFQINPHFMCNSLSAIRMMAMISKNDAIKRMSTSLMVIMEDNLRGTGSFSSVKHEIKNIESYIYIMQVRFGNAFKFEKHIEDDCLKAEIPSMLLQPLIENSILHGLRNINKDGIVKLSIKKANNNLEISIYDNGVGISKKKIKSIFDKTQESSKGFNHIGLSNVKRRLELLYDNKASIDIQSKTNSNDSFFLQIITIPFNIVKKDIKTKYRKENEKNNDS